ncbi:MAG: hypothetical protein K8F91_25975 [Candidatus Obscuribacterales bacterium]|nr:hypothetical protein [Candidatus Obscuribacterales bacterium]
MTLRWPDHKAYNEAIESPSLVFSDQDLQAAVPELSPMGLPRPYSGRFASVYKMSLDGRQYAVKCFRRKYPQQERRYVVISEFLALSDLEYFVQFKYLSPEGIRVVDHWYPVVKMDWVEGLFVDEYVKSNLDNPEALRALSEKWLEMTGVLQGAGIAHGDFQHHNILISQGRITLIDYDGMYVPALAGLVSAESGVADYQHPKRKSQFGPYLDNFSAWLIYLCLVFLAEDKSLHERFGSSECLMIRRSDLLDPDSSELFITLRHHRDPLIRCLIAELEDFLGKQLTDIPPLTHASLARLDSGLVKTVVLSSPGIRLNPQVKRQMEAAPELEDSPIAKEQVTENLVVYPSYLVPGSGSRKTICEPEAMELLESEFESVDIVETLSSTGSSKSLFPRYEKPVFLFLIIATLGIYGVIWYRSVFETIIWYRKNKAYLPGGDKHGFFRVDKTLSDLYKLALASNFTPSFSPQWHPVAVAVFVVLMPILLSCQSWPLPILAAVLFAYLLWPVQDAASKVKV